jgi:hypothetical protein
MKQLPCPADSSAGYSFRSPLRGLGIALQTKAAKQGTGKQRGKAIELIIVFCSLVPLFFCVFRGTT